MNIRAKLYAALSAVTPKTVNWPIVFVFAIYAVVKDAYFGWNLTPKTDAELICDGIGVLVFALALLHKPEPVVINHYNDEPNYDNEDETPCDEASHV